MKSKTIISILIMTIHFQSKASEIKSLLVHPLYNKYFVCAEHWAGQFKEMGDALGTDCMISKVNEKDGLSWLRQYNNDGKNNEDWFGWQENVLAPIDGRVEKVNFNKTTNIPGKMGQGAASFIIVRRNDGVNVMIAHVQDIKVKVGDKVSAGQVIALVGNNGQSRHPHIHIGAWQNDEAFQIQFDQMKIEGRP